MKTYKGFLIFLFSLLFTVGAIAQQEQTISGKVTGPYHNQPIKGAIVTILGQSSSATTDSLGQFSLKVSSLKGVLKVWAPGYYEINQPLLGSGQLTILLMPSGKFRYNQDLVMPLLDNASETKNAQEQNINRKDIAPGLLTVEDILQPTTTGLQVTKKSGMPGEGSYLNLRGIRSMVGNNAPLIVLNGVPYLPDQNESGIIGGYSQSVFNGLNNNDIENITVLKGADASIYGSLGANGVILIETSKASDLNTIIEYSGQYGLAYHTKNLPLLNVGDFKSYIGDIALTKYADMADVLDKFPFLKDDPDYYYSYLYNNNTNWQSKIYRTAFVTDNNLRVKGGDAVAKYDLSVGFMNQAGVLKNTGMKRYNVRLNANATMSKKADLFASIGFVNESSTLHEQGMLDATNPMLAAYYQAPILSPYAKDEYNHQLPSYDTVYQFHVSNPLGAANTISMTSNAYDLTINSGINYHVTNNIKLTGVFGLYYHYNRQKAFIPGKTSGSVVALEDSVAENTARSGVGQKLDFYYNVNAGYNKTWGSHSLSAGLGLQSLITSLEFDEGQGRNTNSDFYTTLAYVETQGRNFYGYTDKWNWLSNYGYLNYDFNKLLFASFIASLDGSSSSGSGKNQFKFFPSGKVTWKGKNMSWFQNSSLLNQLDLHAEYGITGNSRFSSNLSKYYYSSQAYLALSGIVRGNIPNKNLSGETTRTFDLGLEIMLLKNRVYGSVNYYNSYTDDVVLSKPISPVFGTDYIFDNAGEISNKGFEFGLQANLLETKSFAIIVGGTFSMNKNVLESLGGQDEQITNFTDGSSVISKVGKSPYSFYGFVSQGVFSTQSEANDAGLASYNGKPFAAGDIHFKDMNDDHIIDDKDRRILGNANPDYFGSLYANLRFKNISLTADFSYSANNKMYNAVRRSLESMTNYYNQSAAVSRRWQTEGQVTDVPQATYGDPMQNSRFSNRWIENASYIRLTNVTLSYELKEKLFKYIRSGTIFISGENLFTLSNYLGLDPVTSYSYDPMLQGFDYAKAALPSTFKFGVKLQF